MMPGNDTKDVSLDQDVHVFTSALISPLTQCENIAHELYGHAYFYVLNKQGIDVNPLHDIQYIAEKGEYLEEFGCHEQILIQTELNKALDSQIIKVTTQARNNFYHRTR